MTPIVVALLIILILHIFVIRLIFVSSTQLAKKAIDDDKYIRLWKISCCGKFLFVGIVVVCFTICFATLSFDYYEFFKENSFGIIIAGLVLNILATVICTISYQSTESYKDSLVNSLDKALPTDKNNRKRIHFNLKKSVLLGNDSQAQNIIIKQLCGSWIEPKEEVKK